MIYAAVAAVIMIVDTWIKNHMEKILEAGSEKRLARGHIILRKHHNEGAFLNMGENNRIAVLVLSAVLTAGIGVVLVCTLFQKGNHWFKLGLSFLLGGAFCNTYDRIRRKYVMDYLSFDVKWKWFRGIVFNISDFFIMIGALVSAVAYSQKR